MQSLKSHERLHILNETNVYKCLICKKCFASEETLCTHKKHCVNETPVKIKCPICSKEAMKSNMIKHVQTHSVVNKTHQCECNKMFATQEQLKLHRKSHIHATNTCYKCDSPYKSRTGLSWHMLTMHTENTLLSCRICPTTFKDPVVLKRHKTIHTGEKPFECNECRKSFSTPSGLYTHKNSHTKEMAYKCNQCEQFFRARKQLVLHTRKHTGEKPYKCDVCNLAKSSLPQLKFHKSTKHNIGRIPCDQCDHTASTGEYSKMSSHSTGWENWSMEDPIISRERVATMYLNKG